MYNSFNIFNCKHVIIVNMVFYMVLYVLLDDVVKDARGADVVDLIVWDHAGHYIT